MKSIFIIEETKFIYSVFEQTFSQAGIDTYIHHQKDGFSYFIDDLKPELLLVSIDIIGADLAGFKSELSKASHKPKLIAYGSREKLEAVTDEFDGVVAKPIVQATLIATLSGLMTQV
jgi:DNA-binding response OmpR family regulator